MIDSWYETSIDYNDYTKYLEEDTVWCNDKALNRNSISTFRFASVGTRHLKYYTSPNPAVKNTEACCYSRDRFTTKNASTGNKALKYPVGMLTASYHICPAISIKSDVLFSGNGTTEEPYTLAEQ